MNDIDSREATDYPDFKKDRCSERESVFFGCIENTCATICLAGVFIKICTPSLQRMLPSLKPFMKTCSPDTDETQINVSVEQSEIREKGKQLLEDYRRLGRSAAGLSDFTFEQTVLRQKTLKKLIWYDVIYMHGSAMMMDGNAYLFMGASGTGKSTHVRLWREYFGDRVQMINDDKPLIRFEDGMPVVCGSPWNGKHGLGNNIEAPLKGIVRIRRADRNSIRKMDDTEAFKMLYAGTLRFDEKKQMKRLLILISRIIESIPCYELHCNMEAEAVETAYQALKQSSTV